MTDGKAKSGRQREPAGDFLGAFVPAHLRKALSVAVADLGNVVAFAPRRRTGGNRAPAVAAAAAERPVPRPIAADRRWSWLVLVAASLALHAGFLAALLHERDPHASIGLEVISVEVVLGAQHQAGLAPTPSESEVTSPAAPKDDRPEASQPETARRASEKPSPAVEAVEPSQPRPERAADQKPAEQPTSRPEAIAVPKHTRDDGKNARDRATPASTPSVASNSVGRGRSDADTNYRGLVSAHLARYKQFPADARSRGQQGSTTVSFSLDGGGRVTSVRLTRGSGIASIDQETQAMVRRASPFPAPPPSGRSVSFTVPVQFHLR